MDEEIAKRRATGGILIKINSLTDIDVIDKLRRGLAAPAFEVELIVRGICCLLPGVPGHTENISRHQHRRPLPRALAHLLLRRAAADEVMYISSADLMTRNTAPPRRGRLPDRQSGGPRAPA